MKPAPNSRGQVLAAVVVLMVILAALVPLMVFYSQRESNWTAKQARSTTAFHLAEVGIEKGYLAISQSTTVWQNIQNGQTLVHYNFDMSFSDISSGTYAISITSGPLAQEATIISVGRDTLKRELRAIKAIYAKNAVNAAIYGNGITTSGGVSVDWGPIMSRANISLSGSSNVCYPQKLAVGGISTTGTSPQHCHDSWSASTNPCTNGTEYWAYNCPGGIVPSPPTFDLSTYKNLAQNDNCPTASFPAGASPANSCYWPVGQNPSFSNVIMTTTATIYVEGNLSVSNGFLWGSVLAMGNLNFSGGGKGAYTIPTAGAPSPFTGGIPSKAWQQYQYPGVDTAAVAEYYGDAGYQTLNATFQFGMNGNPSKQVGTKDSPSIRGFTYIGGTFGATGSTAFHGVIYSPNGISGGSGGVGVYYDDGVASNIQLIYAPPTRVWWQDVLQSWPAGL